jgi:putative endonuclease
MRQSCPLGMPTAKTVVPRGTGGLKKRLRKMFYAYVLKSQIKNRHYYGHSKNLKVRLESHNNGKVRSTKAHRPWVVIYFEEFETKSKAYKREMFFKSINGYNYLKQKGII